MKQVFSPIAITIVGTLMALSFLVGMEAQKHLVHQEQLRHKSEMKYYGPRTSMDHHHFPGQHNHGNFPDPEAELRQRIGEDVFRTIQQMQNDASVPNDSRYSNPMNMSPGGL